MVQTLEEPRYRPLAERVPGPDGKMGLQLNLHRGQLKALNSTKRIIPVLAGTQSGKTSFGPFWLYKEMKEKGPGDYMVVTPTFPLLSLKLLPEFRRLFEDWMDLGTYHGGATKEFQVSTKGEIHLWNEPQEVKTRVLFGHAQDPESLESATAKAAWADEAGQKKFRASSWEALRRRLSIHQGRILVTTTPYNLGWLKTELYDPWKAARDKGQEHPEIEVVRFKSTANPFFPDAEMEWARANLPPWKFAMFYLAKFQRPAGLIYDAFTEAHKMEGFVVPDRWRRMIGLDFGGTNTAAVYLAERPDDKKLIAYRTYHAGGRTAAEHKAAMLQNEPVTRGWPPPRVVGGAGSENQWRNEFTSAGLPVLAPPITDVEVGINRVYASMQTHRLGVMRDLTHLLDEAASYSRELDDSGEPTEKIEDKNSYHLLDALRYIMADVMRPGGSIGADQASGPAGLAEGEPTGKVGTAVQAPDRSGSDTFFDLPDQYFDAGKDLFT